MIEYEKRTEDGEPVCCDCCGYPAPVDDFTKYDPTNGRTLEDEKWVLCEVCSNTHLSNAIQYPQSCPDSSLYQSVGWIANKLLDELGVKAIDTVMRLPGDE